MLQKIIPALVIILSAFLISACSVKPVSQKTLNAQKSYADFNGVKLKAGDIVPDFSLLDAAGNKVSLSDFKNKQAVLLLFYRGDWCPYCMDQLSDYQTLLPELEKYNIQLIAISPDDLSSMQNTSRRFGQSYIFLSDKNLQVTTRYGIGNSKKLPHPSLFLVDKEGVLLWYYASTDHKVRPSAQQVEGIIKNLF
jgi:peroxiredoxin